MAQGESISDATQPVADEWLRTAQLAALKCYFILADDERTSSL
jgi:hypothetical protein